MSPTSPPERNAATVAMPLMLKRATLLKLLGIGRTLSIELHTPGHPNFDPAFPKPLRLTINGPAFFAGDELTAWIEHLKQMRDAAAAANDDKFDLPQ